MTGHNADFCVENEELLSTVAMECEQQILATSSQITKRAELKVYEDCGLCPLGKDLETFVSSVAKFDSKLFELDFPLVCGDYKAPQLSENLKIGMGLSSSKEILYNSNGELVTTSEGRFRIEGNIEGTSDADGSNISCKLVLEINNKFIDGTEITDFEFSNLFDICCFSYLQEPLYFNYTTGASGPTTGKGFSYTAYYNDNGSTKKIYGEGYTSCIDLSKCTIDPVCITTSVGVDFQNLLTMLSFNFITNNAGQGLTKASVNLGEVPYVNSVTQNLRDNVMNYDDGNVNSNWIWSSQINNNQLEGTLSSVFEGVNQQFSVTLIKENTQNFTFNNILSFSGLRYDELSTDPDNNFLINAKAIDNNGDEQIFIIKMQINGKSIPIVQCTQTINVNYE